MSKKKKDVLVGVACVVLGMVLMATLCMTLAFFQKDYRFLIPIVPLLFLGIMLGIVPAWDLWKELSESEKKKQT